MYNFYALLNRMKYIERWSLMRNNVPENIMEHSAQVSIIAHALAVIRNKYFKGNVNPDKIAVIALFHDASEVITGDMPTPIKYNNPEICKAYKNVEALADNKLLSMLPDNLQKEYESYFNIDTDTEEFKLVKAADKLSAYIKCIEEIKSGNKEFEVAKASIEKTLTESKIPEIKFFMDKFMQGFFEPLDVL